MKTYDRLFCPLCVTVCIIHDYTAAEALVQASSGAGTGQIWLDQVQCVGTETSLADCPANPLGFTDCSHSEDAGVRCSGVDTAGCAQGDIRMNGGPTADRGRVEICNSNTWGTVCDDSWGRTDATVACEQLGYIGSGE
jgi:hypothetical protein